MNKKEINEYLAEHLFGLKKGVDFGEPESFCCKEQEEHFFEYGHIASKGYGGIDWICTECGAVLDERIIGLSPLEDYTENYQQILEKLQEIITPRKNIMIDFNSLLGKVTVYKGFSYCGYEWECCGSGDTIGEAVCKCAVVYLQSIPQPTPTTTESEA